MRKLQKIQRKFRIPKKDFWHLNFVISKWQFIVSVSLISLRKSLAILTACHRKIPFFVHFNNYFVIVAAFEHSVDEFHDAAPHYLKSNQQKSDFKKKHGIIYDIPDSWDELADELDCREVGTAKPSI